MIGKTCDHMETTANREFVYLYKKSLRETVPFGEKGG
jgi:hypothetical protein